MSRLRDAAFALVRAYPGGAESLGPRFSKNPTTLNHEVKGTGQAKLGLDDAAAMSVLSGDLRILNEFAAECDCMVLRMPTCLDDGNGAMLQVARMAREFGDLVSSVSDVMADGQVTANELTRVRREWSALLAEGQALLAHLEAKHEEAIPQATRDAL